MQQTFILIVVAHIYSICNEAGDINAAEIAIKAFSDFLAWSHDLKNFLLHYHHHHHHHNLDDACILVVVVVAVEAISGF